MATATGTQTAKTSLPVLCVDLDGTLIRGNLLWECVLLLAKERPARLFWLPVWLLSGRAHLKRQLAERVRLDPARLPYRQEVIDLLRQHRAEGRRTVLVTAANRGLADAIARYLGLFDEVYGSDDERNLKGAEKAAFLQQRFSECGFDYVGDSAADREVWRKAHGAYVVGNTLSLQQAREGTPVKAVFTDPPRSFSSWVNALRGLHWAKNLLLFLPLALSHKLSAVPILRTLCGFLLFGACASGLYILNDLLDLHSDRDHPWKKARPFASGEISIPQGLFASLLLLSIAMGFGFTLEPGFGLALLGYAALTMWYSLALKRVVLLDVFVLSSFYSFRIIAGAIISKTPLSQWFLAFSLFFFLSLAVAKRYSELVHAKDLINSGASGRGYREEDRELLLSLGIGSSFSAVIILSLYVHSQEVRVLYSSPEFLFLLCPIILYWLSQIWLLAHRGELRDDPVTLAVRDPVSYLVAFAAALVIAASMLQVSF